MNETTDRIEIRGSKDGQFYIAKVAANGEDLLVSETYKHHENAVAAAEREAAGSVPVLDLTLDPD